MKTIGLIGGMSWESTIPYYRIINEAVKQKLGGLHSAKVVLVSVDFDEIAAHQHAGSWSEAGRLLADAARSVQAGGADLILICTNTMHKLIDDVERAVRIPVLHVVDALAAQLKSNGVGKVGLLGTRFTMEQDFYRARIESHGISVIVPALTDRNAVHRVIYEELCQGLVKDASRLAYRDIMGRLIDEGAEAIVLGCTEIAMLVGAQDASVPLYDTTEIHARAAVDFALRADSQP
ncbi:MAG TPA: aspartate/glutamate racemase family protein [Burkholderiaceae bacterium]|jgi:aspartate racemase